MKCLLAFYRRAWGPTPPTPGPVPTLKSLLNQGVTRQAACSLRGNSCADSSYANDRFATPMP